MFPFIIDYWSASELQQTVVPRVFLIRQYGAPGNDRRYVWNHPQSLWRDEVPVLAFNFSSSHILFLEGWGVKNRNPDLCSKLYETCWQQSPNSFFTTMRKQMSWRTWGHLTSCCASQLQMKVFKCLLLFQSALNKPTPLSNIHVSSSHIDNKTNIQWLRVYSLQNYTRLQREGQNYSECALTDNL